MTDWIGVDVQERTASELARFWAKVNKTDTCWLWTASRITGGYGAFSWHGRTKGAHIFAYETWVGPVPPGKELDHTCHVPHCANPEHVVPVTKRENQENRSGPSVNCKSGYRGVVQTGPISWYAQVYSRGAAYREGPFRSAEDANRAAIEMRNRLMTNNRLDRQQQGVA